MGIVLAPCRCRAACLLPLRCCACGSALVPWEQCCPRVCVCVCVPYDDLLKTSVTGQVVGEKSKLHVAFDKNEPQRRTT